MYKELYDDELEYIFLHIIYKESYDIEPENINIIVIQFFIYSKLYIF